MDVSPRPDSRTTTPPTPTAVGGCPECSLPFRARHGGLACECGMDFAPFPRPKLTAAEWDALYHLLKTRSGLQCEARTPDCAAGRRGDLHGLTRQQVSIHHRQPRGAGGTRGAATHSLANLLLICGSGTTGCHGYIEDNRRWAYDTGWLVRHSAPGRPTADTDPVTVPITLSSGRRVLLDPLHPVPPVLVVGLPYAI